MIKIAICDDDNNIINQLEIYLQEKKGLGLDVDVFSSGDELLKYIKTNKKKYNIYFMDIEMTGRNGIETSMAIRQFDDKPLIIFMTQHQNYVFDIFETLPFRFIVKPLDETNFNKILNEAVLHIQTTKQIYSFKIERAVIQVYMDDILYFESIGRKIKLSTIGNEFVYYGKLYEIYAMLNKILFVQTHAAFIINMEHISTINENTIIMINGEHISISKKFRLSVKTMHMKFLEWRCGR